MRLHVHRVQSRILSERILPIVLFKGDDDAFEQGVDPLHIFIITFPPPSTLVIWTPERRRVSYANLIPSKYIQYIQTKHDLFFVSHAVALGFILKRIIHFK